MNTPVDELLALLVEEMGESLHMLGKAGRHGLDSTHPDYGGVRNRDNLAAELGHVKAAMLLLEGSGAVDAGEVAASLRDKLKGVRKYLHHASNRELADLAIEEFKRRLVE